ncbi:MAG: hypothetical protein ACRENE_15110 [Polyangiaceae bacterium]
MIRPFLQALGLVAALVHCSSTRSPAQAAAPAPPHDGQFGTEEQKLTACLDLRDHIVNLYADAYVAGEGSSLSSLERAAFRDGWAEELAKRGTFDRFERSCFYGVTPRKYECGMMSRTTDGLVACMKLSAR